MSNSAASGDARPVVLVTGALAGIGRATALAFGAAGYRVVVSGRRPEAGKALEEALRALDHEARFVEADVRFEEQVSALIDTTVRHFGRLDIAVNNAGIDGKFRSILEHDAKSYQEVFDANVLGTFLSMKHELRAMRSRGSGSIVNISSTMGTRGALNASLYAGSKHAVEGMTKAVALEAAPFSIRVNAVAPGPVQTEMFDRIAVDAGGRDAMIAGVPLKRLGTVEEIAQMILFVASDKVPFLTGEVIRVNGGKTA
ncbi:SDR family NAD(P)-dependent oxidoreductase [Burkholderia plantarii]|uniref:3-oxoacyl-[acyl-carrier protein] reductase FabG n=1 Tax=Burkholderia plantarii TaxID=41899 RepID=A0A0B6S2D3_BURPL|nr:SDR family NAD(P)-dependent oxidoreductase [Burkholderia plantarii]AJK49823.1 3-oxoacyl-[acyl-carrier protein] reductase FabG [Burkholderia plantarii]ALK34043.1 putative short-chain dehydrogenase [Burkholderia plantarii]GLZ21486.1 SDR family oxidoreductase [Burkholderia plantarii]